MNTENTQFFLTQSWKLIDQCLSSSRIFHGYYIKKWRKSATSNTSSIWSNAIKRIQRNQTKVNTGYWY